jgi:uncharacterized membrane protein YgcG
MRNVILFSLPLTIAIAGCGSQPKEQPAAADLERDLTLVTKDRDRTVASPLELGEVQTEQGNTVSHQSAVKAVRHRPARHATIKVAERAPSAPTTHPVLVDVRAPSLAAQPSAAAAVPADSHELPPGKTVTMIPVSSGPSPSESQRGPEDIPSFMTGTGGSGMGGGGSGMGGGGSGMGGGGSGMGGGGSGMGGGCPGRGGEPIGIASY